MASLSGFKTGGRITNWDYYVLQNEQTDKIEFQIEEETTLVSSELTEICILHKSVLVKIIDRNLHVLNNKKYAKVLFQNIIGFVLISKIRKPTNHNGNMTSELEVIRKLDEMIKNHPPLNLQILNEDLSTFVLSVSVTSCVKIPGTPKADFKILGVPEVFISHKKEGGHLAYQQFAGISARSGSNISNHLETQSFLRSIVENELRVPCMRQIQDPMLIRYAVFGPNYGKEYGTDNCHIVAQGNPILDKIDESCYSLNWTEWFIRNSDTNIFNNELVFGATFRSGRKFEIDGAVYNNVRVNIYSIHMLMNRKGLMII